ncbi:MAG: hypothetical protein QG673_1613 [Pseudomonadota bacterium]|nr:hypothetical protein [Pseudomonadota bacterium]
MSGSNDSNIVVNSPGQSAGSQIEQQPSVQVQSQPSSSNVLTQPLKNIIKAVAEPREIILGKVDQTKHNKDK